MVVLFKRAPDATPSAKNRRAEERIPVNLHVELTRYDAEGNASIERTTIEDVTSVGCRFSTLMEFRRGDIVSIQPLVPSQKCFAEGKPQLFEVMWAAAAGSHWTAGARKLEGEQLARVKFPPTNNIPPQTSK